MSILNFIFHSFKPLQADMITNLQMPQLHQMEFSQIITEFFCLLHWFFPLYFVLISFMFYAFNLSYLLTLKLLPLLTQSFAILTFGKVAYAFIHTSYPVTLFRSFIITHFKEKFVISEFWIISLNYVRQFLHCGN